MRTKKITLFALFCALALVLGYFENLIFVSSAMPGIKIGIANIVTMAVFFMFGGGGALLFGLIRSTLSALMYSGIFSIFYSFSGTILSVLTMLIAKKILKEKISPIGTSILGAAAFNIGQLITASIVLGGIEIFLYLPYLLAVSCVSGLATGSAARILLSRISLK